jgi:hypothetical protein
MNLLGQILILPLAAYFEDEDEYAVMQIALSRPYRFFTWLGSVLLFWIPSFVVYVRYGFLYSVGAYIAIGLVATGAAYLLAIVLGASRALRRN